MHMFVSHLAYVPHDNKQLCSVYLMGMANLFPRSPADVLLIDPTYCAVLWCCFWLTHVDIIQRCEVYGRGVKKLRRSDSWIG